MTIEAPIAFGWYAIHYPTTNPIEQIALFDGDGWWAVGTTLPLHPDYVRVVRRVRAEDSMDLRERVLELHRVYEQPIGDRPRDLDEAQRRRRIALVGEEFCELMKGLGVPSSMTDGLRGWIQTVVERVRLDPMDLAEVVDGCEDLKVVVEGTLIEAGVDSGPMGREVHRSNMSKLGPDGKPIKNAVGKFLKGPNYSPPDIATELERQGWSR